MPAGPHAAKSQLFLFLENLFFFFLNKQVIGKWQLHYMRIFRTKRILLTLYDLLDDTEV